MEEGARVALSISGALNRRTELEEQGFQRETYHLPTLVGTSSVDAKPAISVIVQERGDGSFPARAEVSYHKPVSRLVEVHEILPCVVPRPRIS